MDAAQHPPSLPWTIDLQPPQGQTGVVRRNSVFQQEKWALKSCYQCHEVSRRGRVRPSARVRACLARLDRSGEGEKGNMKVWLTRFPCDPGILNF